LIVTVQMTTICDHIRYYWNNIASNAEGVWSLWWK